MSNLNLLLVKTSSLGDVVHTLPALYDIQTHRPDIHIDWLIEPAFADIARLNPHVRDIVLIESKKIRRHKLKMLWSKDYREFKKRLCSRKYDLLIDAQGLLKSAFMTKIADRTSCAGYDKDSIRESLAAKFYTDNYAVPHNLHAVERTRRLCALALDYDYPHKDSTTELPEGLSTTDSEIFPLFFVPDTVKDYNGKSLIFCHGTSRMDKALPIEDWRALAKMASEAGFTVSLPYGNDTEKQAAQAIAKNIDGVTVLPHMPLAHVIISFKNCGGVIGVDTGFTHLSGALNKPTVGLYGATNPILCGALGKYATNIESCDFIDRTVRKIDKSNMQPGLTGIDLDKVWQTFVINYGSCNDRQLGLGLTT